MDLTGKTPEEILSMAREQGLELTDEQLDSISGGSWTDAPAADGCPDCGSHDISYSNVGHTIWFTCKNCGKKWC